MQYPGYRKRSGIAQREPPIACLGRSPGLRVDLFLETAPSRALEHSGVSGLGLAYRCVGSAGIAFVWRTRTGFPFHPRGALATWDT